ncbi:MAG: hypothetical protein V1494_06200 [Candidatus Diapherotrites archaeon]
MDEKIQPKEREFNWFYWFMAILVLLVAALIAFSVYSKPPAGFSEAWLNESNGNNFSFSIKNSFDSAKNFQYKIFLDGAQVADENVLLQAKEEKSLSRKIDLSASNEKQKIEVLVWLEGRQEPFDLWKWVE